jgi:hypothetical protein
VIAHTLAFDDDGPLDDRVLEVECAEGAGRVTGQVDAGTGLLPCLLPLDDLDREPNTGQRSSSGEAGDARADDEDAHRARRAQGPYRPARGAILRFTRNRLSESYFSFTSTRRSKLVP